MDSLQKLFAGMRISASGLKAERARMDIIAQNIANAQTTAVPGTGDPYRRQVVTFASVFHRLAGGGFEPGGVEVAGISGDYEAAFEEVYDPTHPDADERGIVRMPNVNTMKEMADLITAVRAYEANMSVQESFERMAERALRLLE